MESSDANLVEAVKKIIHAQNWDVGSQSRSFIQGLVNGSMSFAVLNGYMEAVRCISNETNHKIDCVISTVAERLVVAARIGKKRERGEKTAGPTTEESRDAIRNSISNLEKACTGDDRPSKVDLESATAVLDSMVCQLIASGSSEEQAVQSYGIFYKKLSPVDTQARIVLAFRVHAGTAVRVSDLKFCLGTCWSDGVITSEVCFGGVDTDNMPLTKEGKLSLEYGNRPVLIVTSIAPKSA